MPGRSPAKKDARRFTTDFDEATIGRLETIAARQGDRSMASIVREAVRFALNHPDFSGDRAA